MTVKKVICFVVLLFTVTFAYTQRIHTSLDGQWEFVRVRSLDEPLPLEGWNTFQVPGTIYGYNYERAWFRRKFFVPQNWRRYRLLLHFGGVKYNSRIYVNGKYVGGCFNGYDAFEVDITEAVRFGSENELLVGVHDWTGVFVGDPVDFEKERRPDLRETPQDRVIAPIGGHYANYGIWDSVTLKVVPVVYFSEVFIRPFVQRKRLEVSVTVVNTRDQPFSATLLARIYRWDGKGRNEGGQWTVAGTPVAMFPSVKVKVEAKSKQTLTLTLDNPPLEFWFPYRPRLYILELKFDHSDSDILRERFGWRQLWCQGGDFYLNGYKVHLLATSWWPPTQGVTRDFVESQLRGIKAMNAVAFRTHTQPWQRIWYEVADEVGLMMIPEAAIWNDDTVYRVNDPHFWENYAAHLKAMVRNLFNHPSIVMWSLTNEFYGSRANDDTPEVEANLARMGLIVKAEDPTRPITYESDGDPGGVADVIGIHYPNEYPEKRLWPNDAYWMDEPRFITGGGGMFWDNRLFLWDRKKPLYIGEFLWVPSRDPSTNTVFFGDEAYRDHGNFHRKAKALAWRMQILAYRHYGVSGISPWSVIEYGALDETNLLWVAQRDMYRPLAAFLREFDFRFFGGTTVHRTVEIFNDIMLNLPHVVFKWQLSSKDKVLSQGSEILKMESGAHIERVLNIRMPKVKKREQLTLRLTLEAEGVKPFNENFHFEVFPKEPLKVATPVRLSLYDTKEKFAPILQRHKIPFERLKRVEDWDGKSILVIGPEALGKVEKLRFVVGATNALTRWLTQKVNNGGKVLVLEQTESASDWLPVQLTEQSSTMAFLHFIHHPILQGLTASDFRWWRGDHIVSRNEPIRPIYAGMLPLVVTGTKDGVSHAPLVEIRQGNGVILVCQLLVISKFESEPIARELLQRLINYLARYRPVEGRIIALGPQSLYESLERLKVDWQPLKDWSTLRYPDVRTLILQSDGKMVAQNANQLKEFIQSGGKLIWHRPDPKEFEKARLVLGLPVTMQPYKGFALRAEGKGTLLNSLFREDFYWLGRATPVEWEPIPLASEMAEAVFAPEVTIANVKKFEAEQEVKLEGQGVGIIGNEISMWTNGRAHWRIKFEETGKYYFALMARGTPVEGIYPMVEVYLDNEKVGVLNIASEKPRLFACVFRTEAGERRLTIAFVNDAFRPPEDRNLWVDYFLLAPIKGEEIIQPLTSPPALVSVPIGKGLLILNSICWDEAGRNGRKAQRLMAGLLTALDAKFRSPETIAILEAEQMTPQENLVWFRKEADHIYMGTNGFIEAKIEIVKAGRYRIGIWAKGTSLEGVYPIVAIELDGKELGRVECKSDDWSVHFINAYLPQGAYTLRLRFINDAYNPQKGEDRNLWVDKIEIEPES
ncbi:MAG: carbohydrate-binding domain-containing protein [Candidatus Fervidibacter sp.]|uniref:carbohydrate-binding domain-containing protein n=2 Tax=Candidatus Fervidibacter sp. TaxID=3100871 RepID=UPI00404ACD06